MPKVAKRIACRRCSGTYLPSINEKGNVTEYPTKKPTMTEIQYMANSNIMNFEIIRIKKNINIFSYFN